MFSFDHPEDIRKSFSDVLSGIKKQHCENGSYDSRVSLLTMNKFHKMFDWLYPPDWITFYLLRLPSIVPFSNSNIGKNRFVSIEQTKYIFSVTVLKVSYNKVTLKVFRSLHCKQISGKSNHKRQIRQKYNRRRGFDFLVNHKKANKTKRIRIHFPEKENS